MVLGRGGGLAQSQVPAQGDQGGAVGVGLAGMNRCGVAAGWNGRA
jgi:hypothetical protein